MALVRDGRTKDAIVEFQHAGVVAPTRLRCIQLGSRAGPRRTTSEGNHRIPAGIAVEAGLSIAIKSLGLALVRNDQAAAAMGHLEQAVRLEPDSAELRYNLGVALLAAKRPADAIVAVRSCITPTARLSGGQGRDSSERWKRSSRPKNSASAQLGSTSWPLRRCASRDDPRGKNVLRLWATIGRQFVDMIQSL